LRTQRKLALRILRQRFDSLLVAVKKCLAKHYNFVMIGEHAEVKPPWLNEVDMPQLVVEAGCGCPF
jgi:hypothetical protein